MGSSISALPGRNFARFFLMNFILFSLVMRTGYQGVQYDMMLKVCLIFVGSSLYTMNDFAENSTKKCRNHRRVD
jgi:hypothetical protein